MPGYGAFKGRHGLIERKSPDACMSGVGLNKMQAGFIYFLLS